MRADWKSVRAGLALFLSLGLTGEALAEAPMPRMITDAEAPGWASVGRLNVAGNRSCTATLISDHEAITAAHCLFHPVTHHRADPADIRFVLGQRRDTYVAVRGVVAVAILPGYVPTGVTTSLAAVTHDLALLNLDAPVSATDAVPMAVADWPLDATVDIVGYGRDRPYMAAIRAGCPGSTLSEGVLVVECIVVPGLSGAPVTVSNAGPIPRLVAVVAASVGERVNPVKSLAVPVAVHLAALRALLQ